MRGAKSRFRASWRFIEIPKSQVAAYFLDELALAIISAIIGSADVLKALVS